MERVQPNGADIKYDVRGSGAPVVYPRSDSVGWVRAGDRGDRNLGEFSDRQCKSAEWIAALDEIESLQPSTVIAGHKVPDGDDSPRHVTATRTYIQGFDRLNAETKTSSNSMKRTLQLHPDRANPGLYGEPHTRPNSSNAIAWSRWRDGAASGGFLGHRP